MNRTEAAMLLTVAASFDGRTPTDEDAIAWAAALHDIRFVDAREAVVGHYRESRQWVMPADIFRRVRQFRRDRLVGLQPMNPPRELADNPRAEQAWQRAVRAAIADGLDPAAAAAAASRQMGVSAPLALGSGTPPPAHVNRELRQIIKRKGIVE